MPPLASRWRRLIARIIDGLLVAIPVSLVFSAATWGWDWDMTDNDGRSTSLGIIIAVVYFVYEGLMLTTRGQTVGKMAMKIRVAMLDNGAVPEESPAGSAPPSTPCPMSCRAAASSSGSSMCCGARGICRITNAFTTKRPRPWWSQPCRDSPILDSAGSGARCPGTRKDVRRTRTLRAFPPRSALPAPPARPIP
ncbi:RDD family protein [Streptomyces stramineus]